MPDGVPATPCPCGERPAHAGQLVCRACLSPLALARAAGALTELDPGVHESPLLVLHFDAGVVELRPGQRTVLGRNPQLSPHAHLFAGSPTVSGRHAEVALAPDGRARVTDQGSRNHTFVNDVRVPAHASHPLHDGDRLRFASGVRARVVLRRSAP